MGRSRSAGRLGAAALALPMAVVILSAIAAGAGSPNITPSGPTGCTPGAAVGSAFPGGTRLDAGQVGNAQIIYTVSSELGLPQRAAVIAIATALQESSLRDLTTATNNDSLGLFQQRPSQGWGTAAELTDPVAASKAFYTALVRIPNWSALPLTVAAQDVQHSADPGAYMHWEPLADQLVATASGASTDCQLDDGASNGTGTTTVPEGFTIPVTTDARVVIAITWALRQLGGAYSYGGDCTDPLGADPAHQCDCSSLVMMAYRAAGIELPRSTFEQVGVGTPIYAIADLEPGDLLFEAGAGDGGSASAPGHVGMFVGSGLVIEAPHTGARIRLDPLSQWTSQIVAMRRVTSGTSG